MTSLRVRAAGPDERGAIASIEEASARAALAHIFPGQPYPTDRTLRRWRDYDGALRVAEADGRLVGFVAWSGAALHALYVLPDAAGAGVGSRLLAEAAEASTLWVLEGNHAARRFYERRLWAPDGATKLDPFGIREVRYRRQRG